MSSLGSNAIAPRLRTFAFVTLAIAGLAVAAAFAATRHRPGSFPAGVEVVCPPSPPRFVPQCTFTYSPEPSGAGETHAAGSMFVDGPASPRHDQRWVEGSAAPNAGRTGGAETDAITAATRRERMVWSSAYRDRIPSTTLQVIHPPQGAVFPANLCAPWVTWEDEQNDLWKVTFAVEGRSESVVTQARSLRIPERVWQEARRTGGGTLEVRGALKARGDGARGRPIHCSPPVRFTVSRAPADNFIVYRLVPPPFHMRKTPSLYLRDVRSLEQREFFKGRDLHCINCHGFSQSNERFSVNIRYVFPDGRRPGALGIYDFAQGRGQRLGFSFANQGTQYSAWNADGTRLVTAVNQAFMSAFPLIHETQELEYDQSDLAVWEYGSTVTARLPGADLAEYTELYPAWTADGKEIVFARAKASLPAGRLKFELYRIPYNDGAGGAPAAIPGAAGNGRSNYFPRCSPDGRWLAFCMADEGSLVKTSSDIYLVPLDGSAPPRRLESNVDYAADSWHSWSSNSRWLLFASKRDDGLFTRLYFTRIDDAGHASPPVRLPVEEPLYEAFNVPEFCPFEIETGADDLYEAFRFEAPLISLPEVAAR